MLVTSMLGTSILVTSKLVTSIFIIEFTRKEKLLELLFIYLIN